jgi:hypothetical protein
MDQKKPAERVAERKWGNNALRKKIKEGKTPVPMMVNPGDIDYVNKKVRVDKNAPPEVATVIENKAKRRPGGFERRFLKEVRAILEERKRENVELIRASLRHQRLRLMLEKLRRLELMVAESEKRIAERQNATKSKDLFA